MTQFPFLDHKVQQLTRGNGSTTHTITQRSFVVIEVVEMVINSTSESIGSVKLTSSPGITLSAISNLQPNSPETTGVGSPTIVNAGTSLTINLDRGSGANGNYVVNIHSFQLP